MTQIDTSGLTQFGFATRLPARPDVAVPERGPVGRSGTLCVRRFTAPECAGLSPMHGQPEFAQIVIDDIPIYAFWRTGAPPARARIPDQGLAPLRGRG